MCECVNVWMCGCVNVRPWELGIGIELNGIDFVVFKFKKTQTQPQHNNIKNTHVFQTFKYV